MQVSKASPELFMHVATGEHIKQGILIGRKAGSTQFEFIKWTFTDVLVSSYQHAGSSLNDSLPLAQVSISFQKIEVDYTTQSADGKPGTTFHGGWDLATNKTV
jgi:type VI secretion system secreted protein Hcp